MQITKLLTRAVGALASAATATATLVPLADAETPYSFCLKAIGMPYDSNPSLYISLGNKALYYGQSAVQELEKQGVPHDPATAIATCAPKLLLASPDTNSDGPPLTIPIAR